MKVGISAKPDVVGLDEIVARIERSFEGHELFYDTDAANALSRTPTPLEKMDVELLVTIGGDGTILRAFQRSSAKILGVNAGVMGFLTEVGLNEVEPAIERILSEDYKLDERTKLKILMDGKRLYDCLNEVVIHTAQVAKMRHFKICIDGCLADDFRADGLMVATPTGSTSYAMSAGGPIIDPRVEAMVMVPIAPFKLSGRPLVVPSRSSIEVTLESPKECHVVLDGQEIVSLKGEERMEVTESEYKARFIRFEEDFYARFMEKLGSQ